MAQICNHKGVKQKGIYQLVSAT